MATFSDVIPKAANAATKTAASSQVPHNIVLAPSTSVARKTPTTAGITIGKRMQTSAGKSLKQNNTSATKVPVAPVPTQSYDGSTAKNSSYVPGKANYSTQDSIRNAIAAKLKGLGK